MTKEILQIKINNKNSEFEVLKGTDKRVSKVEMRAPKWWHPLENKISCDENRLVVWCKSYDLAYLQVRYIKPWLWLPGLGEWLLNFLGSLRSCFRQTCLRASTTFSTLISCWAKKNHVITKMVHLNHHLNREIVCHQSHICSWNIDKNELRLSQHHQSSRFPINFQNPIFSRVQKHHHHISPIPNFSIKFQPSNLFWVKKSPWSFLLGGLLPLQTSCVHGDAMTLRNWWNCSFLQSLGAIHGGSPWWKFKPLRSLRYTWTPTSEFQKITSQDDTNLTDLCRKASHRSWRMWSWWKSSIQLNEIIPCTSFQSILRKNTSQVSQPL